jgi:hypothetical protein
MREALGAIPLYLKFSITYLNHLKITSKSLGNNCHLGRVGAGQRGLDFRFNCCLTFSTECLNPVAPGCLSLTTLNYKES